MIYPLCLRLGWTLRHLVCRDVSELPSQCSRRQADVCGGCGQLLRWRKDAHRGYSRVPLWIESTIHLNSTMYLLCRSFNLIRLVEGLGCLGFSQAMKDSAVCVHHLFLPRHNSLDAEQFIYFFIYFLFFYFSFSPVFFQAGLNHRRRENMTWAWFKDWGINVAAKTLSLMVEHAKLLDRIIVLFILWMH